MPVLFTSGIADAPDSDVAPVALVTGAAGGIGRAVVQRLAAGGAAVCLVDRSASGLAETADQLRAAGVDESRVACLRVDVVDADAAERAVAHAEAQLGPLTMLACVAGVLRPASIADADDQTWLEHFDVNTTAVFRFLRAATRGMAARRHGAVVVVTSNAAAVPRMGMSGYAASKAATSMLVRCAGLELAEAGIRCNTVEPGSTDTAMQRDLWPDPEAGRRAALHGDPDSFRVGIPLGRIAAPADIADAVAFLLSDAARHITMQSLRIDGGATL